MCLRQSGLELVNFHILVHREVDETVMRRAAVLLCCHAPAVLLKIPGVGRVCSHHGCHLIIDSAGWGVAHQVKSAARGAKA
eukprot:5999620-Alexandrium_andersonii.AAC.1